MDNIISNALNADAIEVVKYGWGCPLVHPISSIRQILGSEIIGYINYILPIKAMAAILVTWVVAIGTYYVASVILRWVKAIS